LNRGWLDEIEDTRVAETRLNFDEEGTASYTAIPDHQDRRKKKTMVRV